MARSWKCASNDRGPSPGVAILDLSYGAARILGAVGSGVIPVRLRVIALPGGDGPAGDDTGTLERGFSVQLGAFTSRARATACAMPWSGTASGGRR